MDPLKNAPKARTLYQEMCAVRRAYDELDCIRAAAARCRVGDRYVPQSLRALDRRGTLKTEYTDAGDVALAEASAEELARVFREKWGFDAPTRLYPLREDVLALTGGE